MKIVINVCGGCVTSVMADNPDIEVTLRDWDNISGTEEDIDPMSEFVTDRSESQKYGSDVDWVKAGYPHEVY